MNYHPDIEYLLRYANGQLTSAMSIAVGLHQKRCQQCQAVIADIENLAGNHLEQSRNADLSIGGFENIMAQIDIVKETSLRQQKDCEAGPLINFDEKQLTEAEIGFSELAIAQNDIDLFNQLFNQEFSQIKWNKIMPGISQYTFDLGDSSSKCELIQLSPLSKTPKHTHQGNEFTLVLQGSFEDCYGKYGVGEFMQMNQQNEHQPKAGIDGCICLAITERPLKFTGLLGPIINWLAS